jgi:dihydroorotate dehydrogenase electron transfer subunit
MSEKPKMLKIEKIVDECDKVKTFYFNHKLCSKPGQFVIVWLPGVDEKPMSVSYQDEKMFGITVLCVGPFTEKMHKLKEGDLIGIRGPYGNFFNLFDDKRKIAIVGGGCGCAPTAFLADYATAKGFDVRVVLAGKSKNNIMFEERMKKSGAKVYVTTDDGSYGKKGFATDALREIIDEVDVIYTCGPEKMMKTIYDMSSSRYLECSLERYMKCGFGLCRQCCLDPTGERVCKEGPVFDKKRLSKISEFGKYHRDATGKKIDL